MVNILYCKQHDSITHALHFKENGVLANLSSTARSNVGREPHWQGGGSRCRETTDEQARISFDSTAVYCYAALVRRL